MVRSILRNLVYGPLSTRLRRFVTVGTLAAGVQMALLWAFVEQLHLYYLTGAFIAIEISIAVSYVLNNEWTFHEVKKSTTREYLFGFLKTNVVRGTAIPLQLFILYVLVEFGLIPYLLANAVAILISGVYRYVLDVKWTWA